MAFIENAEEEEPQMTAGDGCLGTDAAGEMVSLINLIR